MPLDPDEEVLLSELLDLLLLTKEDRLKSLLQKRRRAKVAQAAISVPPMPTYVAPDDPADMLNYEYGMELAFRPNQPPHLILPEKLVPLLCVAPKIDPSKSRSRHSSLFLMYQEAAPNYAAQIGAKHGSYNMSTCSWSEIEFPSPIMTKLSQIEWYYNLIRSVADGIGATVDNSKTNSGGGHLHVTPIKREWTDWEQYAIIMAMCEQPWLGWVFNDPDDSETAVSPAPEITRSLLRHPNADHWWEYIRLSGDSVAVRPNDQTITTMEFRIFQAPLNWAEQRLHVLFLNRWLGQVLKDPKRTVPKQMPAMSYMFPQDLMGITFDKASRAFNKTLSAIGLDPADYAPFVERNMKVRYDKGWTRN